MSFILKITVLQELIWVHINKNYFVSKSVCPIAQELDGTRQKNDQCRTISYVAFIRGQMNTGGIMETVSRNNIININ